MKRQSIVAKLNSKEKFNLTHDEIEYILENWISTHSQHLTKVDIKFNTDQGVSADVELNKDSFYKHF